MQLVWLANVHLEGSPYRPNDRISQLKHALHRLESHIGGAAGAWTSGWGLAFLLLRCGRAAVFE